MQMLFTQFSCVRIIEYLSLISNTACQPFTFKNTLSNDNMCQPCPMFSNTSGVATATAVCPCDSGYFRPLDGSEDTMACTREYTTAIVL